MSAFADVDRQCRRVGDEMRPMSNSAHRHAEVFSVIAAAVGFEPLVESPVLGLGWISLLFFEGEELDGRFGPCRDSHDDLIVANRYDTNVALAQIDVEAWIGDWLPRLSVGREQDLHALDIGPRALRLPFGVSLVEIFFTERNQVRTGVGVEERLRPAEPTHANDSLGRVAVHVFFVQRVDLLTVRASYVQCSYSRVNVCWM